MNVDSLHSLPTTPPEQENTGGRGRQQGRFGKHARPPEPLKNPTDLPSSAKCRLSRGLFTRDDMCEVFAFSSSLFYGRNCVRLGGYLCARAGHRDAYIVGWRWYVNMCKAFVMQLGAYGGGD